MKTAVDAIVFNLQETRRRSIKLWRSLPDERLSWRPDEEAMSFGEMIRHVGTSTYLYHLIVINNGSLKEYPSVPFENDPIESVEQETERAQTYFDDFIRYVSSLTDEDMETRIIDRSDAGYRRGLGDMLLRIAYHDSVHAGQFLQYMRMAGIERPKIWD
ncbi:DinB family protein [Paenibacillus alkalitolerans]|uniref:DinB family protein n=1 Tax=Paenibacillus alkalitolerans TaxID=2799335 RepID=UPI0018F63EE4|nr:DinB family protein [Paenibacillus alkalitolerans]